MANEWYVQHGGKLYGPLTPASLKKLAAEGKIGPTTSVRLGAEGNWVPASRVQGLFATATSSATTSAPPPAKKAAAPNAAMPLAPPIEPPPAPPRANPLGMPVAPLQPRSRVPKAVPAEAPSIAPKIIGGVAIILGTVAVSTCWLPVMGGAIGWTGIVTGAIGLVIGGAGLAMAALHKGSGLMLNVSGAASSAVGLVLSVVLGIALGMFTTAAPKTVAVVPKIVQPAPAPVQQPEPEPEPEIVWTDASQPIQQDPIKAQIVAVAIEQLRLEAADLSTMRKGKPQPMLKIKIAVENTSTDKIVQFTGWVGGGDLIGQGVGQLLQGSELGKAVQSAAPTANLTDNVGNKYPQTPTVSVFGAQLPTGDNSLRPGQTRQAELVFPPPLPTIEVLRLELSPAAYGGSEPLRWQIPKAMITGLGG